MLRYSYKYRRLSKFKFKAKFLLHLLNSKTKQCRGFYIVLMIINNYKDLLTSLTKKRLGAVVNIEG